MSKQRRVRYDRGSTVFSPEGRIYQVEYALELVKKGAPIVGIKSEEGVVLGGIVKRRSPLASHENNKKIYGLDEHVGTAIAGLSPDARVLIREARYRCQGNRLTYDEPIDVQSLTEEIGDIYQTYTQQARVRPFGVNMIIGGVDYTGARIASIDPSGSYRIYKATAVGQNEDKAKEKLKELYREDLSLTETKSIAINALKTASEEELTSKDLALAVVPIETGEFRELTVKEIEERI